MLTENQKTCFWTVQMYTCQSWCWDHGVGASEEIKNGSHMFKMRNKVRAEDKDIIHVHKTVSKSSEDLIR